MVLLRSERSSAPDAVVLQSVAAQQCGIVKIASVKDNAVVQLFGEVDEIGALESSPIGDDAKCVAALDSGILCRGELQ